MEGVYSKEEKPHQPRNVSYTLVALLYAFVCSECEGGDSREDTGPFVPLHPLKRFLLLLVGSP